jgi:superfamily II DNA or RNA helicase
MVDLPDGTFVLPVDGGGVAYFVVSTNTSPIEPLTERFERIEDSHVLVRAAAWFTALWAGAEPVGKQPAFHRGELAGVAGSDELGEVVSGDWDGEGYTYKVRLGGGVRQFTEAGLRRIDLDQDDPTAWVREQPGTARQVSLLLTHTKLSHPLSDTVYSYGASKTIYRPYQFKPVLRLISSPRKRLLIADEVGLGKTIEAGLVWTELEQRTTLTRALVVCPAMLVPKWRDEMRRRFDRDLRVLDAHGVDEMLGLFRRGDDLTPMYGVVSLERLRSARVLEQLQAVNPSFDLAIVDEAHYLRNPESLSHDVGELLSDWADALLFLSATPLNLGQDDLFSLLNLLLPEEFNDKRVLEEQLEPNAVLTDVARYLRHGDRSPRHVARRLTDLALTSFGSVTMQRPEARELFALLAADEPLTPRELAAARRQLANLHPLATAVTRTRKVDVPEDKAVRQAMPIEVEWTDEEYAFYRAVHEWTIADSRERGVPAGFGAQMPLRQTASCLPAMIERLTARDVGDEADDLIDIDDGNVDDLNLDQAWNAADRRLETLRSQAGALARKVTVDSKLLALKQRLRQLRSAGERQVMVFSFFRRTLEYLGEQLRGEWKVEVMHGGVDFGDRERIMRRFRAGDIDLLLLSEVGSEGLDFEFCSVVVNYDLPWNPMRVEQRIGRIDRFGQRSEKIFILNFHVPGTIETDILERLYERLGVFERSIGELEPVIRSELGDLEKVVLDPNLSPAEREQRLREKATAVEERALQLADLDQARTQLAGIDDLMVDGLDREIDRGRYIGPAELRAYVEASLRHDTGARLRGSEHGAQLIGDQRLQRRLVKHVRSNAGTRYGLSELGRLLADEEPIAVTFDQAVASTENRELISARHPLVVSATKHFTESSLLVSGRFGAVTVDKSVASVTGTYAVVVYLLEVTGLRSSLELWPVAIDVDHHTLVDGVGDALLAALAKGALTDDRKALRSDLATDVEAAQSEALALLRREERERRASNAALVDGRVAAVRSEIAHKVARARQTLERVSDPAIVRLHQGRIRNLEADEERRIGDLEEKRPVAASMRPIAALQVTIR